VVRKTPAKQVRGGELLPYSKFLEVKPLEGGRVGSKTSPKKKLIEVSPLEGGWAGRKTHAKNQTRLPPNLP
jgi:hypothetical protein